MISIVVPDMAFTNITWPLGGAGWHVLDKAEHRHDVCLGFASGNRLDRAEDGGRAAHIPFHFFHAAGGLQRDTAGVEADPFAHKSNWCFAFFAALPLHHGDIRFIFATLRHAEQGAHAKLFQISLPQDFDFDAELFADFQGNDRRKLWG